MFYLQFKTEMLLLQIFPHRPLLHFLSSFLSLCYSAQAQSYCKIWQGEKLFFSPLGPQDNEGWEEWEVKTGGKTGGKEVPVRKHPGGVLWFSSEVVVLLPCSLDTLHPTQILSQPHLPTSPPLILFLWGSHYRLGGEWNIAEGRPKEVCLIACVKNYLKS